jgi:hypothetical protein
LPLSKKAHLEQQLRLPVKQYLISSVERTLVQNYNALIRLLPNSAMAQMLSQQLSVWLLQRRT